MNTLIPEPARALCRIDEIADDTMAISSVAAYCAFLGIVGAATFWLIARPDHARWRGRPGESISHGPDTEHAPHHPPFLRAEPPLALRLPVRDSRARRD